MWMRLEMGTFPVKDVAFGSRTRWSDGLLEINRDEILVEILKDPRIEKADLELAKPGESTRIYPVRDVIEPRAKVEGSGVCYPGTCGRSVETVGTGRTHRLANVGVLEVSNAERTDSVGSPQIVDMSGPWGELVPASRLNNVCALTEADSKLGVETQNEAVHNAALTVADMLAQAIVELKAPEVEVFELPRTTPDLPGVVYVQCIHSPEAMTHDDSTYCVGTYGMTGLTSPWMLHPCEILDGAISGPYRTPFATSWAVVNNPVVLELFRRHGKDLNFLGVLSYKTEWTTQWEKELMGHQAGKMVKMAGADGALFTWDAGGNEFMEVIYAVRACERLGVKTVFLTSEDTAEGGAPTMLEPIPEADAIVSTGFFSSRHLGLTDLPAAERVIGNPVYNLRRGGSVKTAEAFPIQSRYDDHYGFNRYTTYPY